MRAEATADEAKNADGSAEERSRGRRWTPYVLAAAFCLAGYLLYRMFSQYDAGELTASVADFPARHLLTAGACAAASYLCLTGFDWLALRYVHRPLAWPRAALASFTSLSIGHNLGLAALSSGAIRYRFYTRWGLAPGEVAKVIVFCGVTVGLGLMVLGGAALLVRPGLAEEITRLDRPLVIALGGACIAVPLLYLVLAATVRRTLTIRGWSLEPPPLRLALAQLVIGAVNFAFVAGCLHQTLAALGDVAYPSVAAAYVIANATALVSHVPGGLGVIESVVMFLLPQADLLAALLVFRFVYFLVPLVLGGVVFATTELVWRQRGAPSAAPAAGES